MQMVSIKQLSIPGKILIATSTITAAVLPKNYYKEISTRAGTDRLVASSFGGLIFGATCLETVDDDCDDTTLSSTTIQNTGGTIYPAATNDTSSTDQGANGSSTLNSAVIS